MALGENEFDSPVLNGLHAKAAEFFFSPSRVAAELNCTCPGFLAAVPVDILVMPAEAGESALLCSALVSRL